MAIIVEKTVTGSINRKRNARLVSKLVCLDANGSVPSLQSDASCSLAARAWSLFHNADGLIVFFLKGDTASVYRETAGSKDRVEALMSSMPGGRLKRFYLLPGSPAGRCTTPWGRLCGSAILGSPHARTLAHVLLQDPITPELANQLLRNLPRLEHLDVLVVAGMASAAAAGVPLPLDAQAVVGSSGKWSPAGCETLRVLIISSKRLPEPRIDRDVGPPGPKVLVDMAGVARSSGLIKLTASSVDLLNTKAFQRLGQLQVLKLTKVGSLLSTKHLQQLHELKSVSIDWEISASQWDYLAGLERLEHLAAWHVKLRPGTPGEVEQQADSSSSSSSTPGSSRPSSSITSLCLGDLKFTGDTADRPAEPLGYLSRLLPNLQELQACPSSGPPAEWAQHQPRSASVANVMEMLTGHGAIRTIHLTDLNHTGNSSGNDDWQWPQGSLSSLHATLEEFALLETRVVVGDAVLAEAACCSKLRLLDLCYRPRQRCDSSGYSEAGLRALAAGACSGTLQELNFDRCERRLHEGPNDGGAALAALVAALTAAPVPAGAAGAAAAPACEAAPLASAIPLLLLPAVKSVYLPLSVPQQLLPPEARMRKAHLLTALEQQLVQGLRAAGSMVQVQAEDVKDGVASVWVEGTVKGAAGESTYVVNACLRLLVGQVALVWRYQGLVQEAWAGELKESDWVRKP